MQIAALTLRQKIGQTVMLNSSPQKIIEQFGSIKNFLQQYPVGGFL